MQAEICVNKTRRDDLLWLTAGFIQNLEEYVKTSFANNTDFVLPWLLSNMVVDGDSDR